MGQWHYTNQTGAQCGPIPESELKDLIQKGIVPNTGMVWKEGMAQWQIHSQLPELQVAPVKQPTAPTPTTSISKTSANPYNPPSAQSHSIVDASIGYVEYEGIRRLNYFLRNVLLFIGYPVILFVIFYTALHGSLENTPPILALIGIIATYLAFLYLFIRIKILRIRNIGYSAWWLLLMLVPLVNFIQGVALSAFPEGYAPVSYTHLTLPTICSV